MKSDKRIFKKGIQQREGSTRLKGKVETLRKEKRAAISKRVRLNSDAAISTPSIPLTVAFEKAKSSSITEAAEGLRSIRQHLCLPVPPIDLCLGMGVISLLTSFLVSPSEDLKIEASWCLTNIATGDHVQTGHVLQAVPSLLNILECSTGSSSVTISLQEQACWTLGNIAGDSDEYRAVLIANGCLRPCMALLLDAVRSSVVSTSTTPTDRDNGYLSPQPPAPPAGLVSGVSRAETAAWTLSNLARGATPASTFTQPGYTSSIIDVMIRSTDCGTISELCWVLAFLTAKGGEADSDIDLMLQQGLLPALIHVVQLTFEAVPVPDASASVVTPIASGKPMASVSSNITANAHPITAAVVPLVRCIGNLSGGRADWTDALLTYADGVLLRAVVVYATHARTYHGVSKECLWVLSNILGGTHTQRVAALETTVAFALAPPVSFPHPASSIHRADFPAVLQPVLNVLLLEDHFDAQREAVLALGNACLNEAVLRLVSRTAEVFAQLVRLLSAPDTDVVLTCVQVIHECIRIDGNVKQLCMELDLLEALDALQYGPVTEDVRLAANSLADEFEEDDDEQYDNDMSIKPLYTSPQPANGGGGGHNTTAMYGPGSGFGVVGLIPGSGSGLGVPQLGVGALPRVPFPAPVGRMYSHDDESLLMGSDEECEAHMAALGGNVYSDSDGLGKHGLSSSRFQHSSRPTYNNMLGPPLGGSAVLGPPLAPSLLGSVNLMNRALGVHVGRRYSSDDNSLLMGSDDEEEAERQLVGGQEREGWQREEEDGQMRSNSIDNEDENYGGVILIEGSTVPTTPSAS